MPIDPRSYFINVPQTGGPMDVYRDYMSLRDLMDQRRYRDLQERRLQMQLAEDEDKRQQAQALRDLFKTGKTPTREQILSVAPLAGIPLLKNIDEQEKEARLAEKAKLEADAERAKALANRKQIAFDKFKAIQTVKDPATRDRMFMSWQAQYQDIPDLVQGAAYPIDAAGTAYVGTQALGAPEYQKYEAAQEQTGQERTKRALDISDAQRKQAEYLYGLAEDQPSWDRFLKVLPPEMKPQFSPMFSPAEKRRGANLFLTEQQRQQEARQAMPNTGPELIIWKNQPGRTPQEIAQATSALKEMLDRELEVARATAGIKEETTPATGPQATALRYYQRGRHSLDIIESLEAQMRDKNLWEQGVYAFAPNAVQSETNQRYKAAQRRFTEARLRKDSGAGIPEYEYRNDEKAYFAQPGDKPATLADKQEAREMVLHSIATESGKAYREYYGAEPARPKLRDLQNPTANTGTNPLLNNKAPEKPPAGKPFGVAAPDGKTYWFGTKTDADVFKKRAGIP